MATLKDEIYNVLKELIVKKLCVDGSEISLETKFADDLNADSLDLVELLISFEEVYEGVVVPDNAGADIITVEDAVDALVSIIGEVYEDGDVD